MLKYTNTGVVFQEIPDETTLAINISGCPCRCPGCHSKYLWEDVGLPLDTAAIDDFVEHYGRDITCICFMGGDADARAVSMLAQYVREEHPQYRIGWYSGRLRIPSAIDTANFDYIKIGPFIKHLGPLNSPTTNQRLLRILPDGRQEDLTSRFWRKSE